VDSTSTTYDHPYKFTVAPYVTLPTNTMTALGSGSNPGFRLKSFQTANTNILNGWQNNVTFAIEGAEGFYAGNEADLSSFTHNGEFWQSSVINFSQNSGGTVT